MMKSEFEELIGKEVDNGTFEMYNSMYLSLPEGIDKATFVKMLNIDAIPESEDALRRRSEKEVIVKGIKEEIMSKVEDIQYYKADNERCKILLKEDIDKEDKKIFRERVKRNNRIIMNLKIAIKELKYVIGE